MNHSSSLQSTLPLKLLPPLVKLLPQVETETALTGEGSGLARGQDDLDQGSLWKDEVKPSALSAAASLNL